jgi:hypothetical protein
MRLDSGAPPTQIRAVLKRNPFIVPSAPALRREPPTGEQWIHEPTRTREAPVRLLLSGSNGPSME